MVLFNSKLQINTHHFVISAMVVFLCDVFLNLRFSHAEPSSGHQVPQDTDVCSVIPNILFARDVDSGIHHVMILTRPSSYCKRR